jgi:hypothetical protein
MKYIDTFNEHVNEASKETSKGTAYKFYKLLGNKWKYADTFYSTLDPEYHSYINWCKENDIRWKLVRVFDEKIMFEG